MNTIKIWLGLLTFICSMLAIPAWAGIDLIMTDVSTTATTVPAGTSFTVSYGIKNQGTSPASNVSANYYLSTDATITTADTLIGNQVIGSLGVGTNYVADKTVGISSGMAPGTYYIGMIVDPNNYVAETDETNNVMLAVGTITVYTMIAPGAPTNVTAIGGNAQATVSFTAPAPNGGPAITGYTATSNPGSLTGTCTASPCTVSGLTNGTAYTFTVKATNAAGAGAASAASNSVTPTGTAQAYYIHTDHLDTPREITDSAGNVVWRWDNSDPFGANMANENPNGAGQFVFPLRFPGQYFDRETNTHYNINRDYNPAIGAYIESDPIGLQGGINTYGYVGGNPLIWVDPFGLDQCTIDLQQLIQNAINGQIDPNTGRSRAYKDGGNCANMVRDDLANAHGPVLPHLGSGKNPSPGAWGNTLINSGCYRLVTDPNYMPQPGDLAITVGANARGHASIYDGTTWDADIATNNANPNTTNPSSPYHDAKPVIYQYTGTRN